MVRMWRPQGGGNLPALDRAAARPALGPPLAGSARSGGVSAPGPAVWGGARADGAGAPRDPRLGAGTQLPCAAGLRAVPRAAHAATPTPLPSRKRPTAPTQFPRGSRPAQRARTYRTGTAAEGGDGASVRSGSDEGAAGCRPTLRLRTARVRAGAQAQRGAREEEEAPPSPARWWPRGERARARGGVYWGAPREAPHTAARAPAHRCPPGGAPRDSPQARKYPRHLRQGSICSRPSQFLSCRAGVALGGGTHGAGSGGPGKALKVDPQPQPSLPATLPGLRCSAPSHKPPAGHPGSAPGNRLTH